ncbi:Predicted phage phi-C31 gp36 major capsid-like protein [Streptococcus pneumoniae]|uniref:phage major capsid protein n=1 Tax=Stutzerimonas stutzeri TaxID=316 RepID=UPI0005E3AA08|nr:phage major capsid protein [Stutzerimonas stutzeri]CJK78757.1 Predicted phage phi-C31 gp36 major capsid-like protein [Streptococcus pneumoniae]HAJ88500.1 phage major capsid protein [Pseudomonas sp.]RRV33534.1 phage major capsid protein [Stutzerimonas stutzeri]RRV39452.1 phage major capsid protein [Stutzerimonas stutzeri]RRW14285.1 phage major capsid protein [Stutzerimonas stutzeri]
MSFEIVAKSLEEHGAAVQSMKDDLTKEVKGLGARMFELEQKASRGGEFMESGQFGRKSNPVASFIESPQLESLTRGANSTGRVELKGGDLRTLRKAITSTDVSVQPQRAVGLYDNPQRRLSLLDLLPSLPVTSGTFEFMALTTAANGAAVQIAEGDQKAESTPGFEVRQATISTIAHWVRASMQILSDAPALERQLSDLMTYGAQSKLEAEILNGDGTAGRMLGILPQATLFTGVNALDMTPVDRVGEAVTLLGASGWNASAIAMNHADWFAIASTKDTSAGYIIGSPRDPSPLNLWGVPVVLSAALPIGTALVMDTAQLAILDRQQVTVMASREDRDNWTTNQVTLLAELRAGLAVFAPGAVLEVSLTTA